MSRLPGVSGHGGGVRTAPRPIRTPHAIRAGAAVAAACCAGAARLLRSAGFRFALVYALLLGGQRRGAGAVPVVVHRRPARPADRGGDPAPTPRACRSAAPTAACPPLVLTIEDRLTQNVDDDAIYLLVDPTMRRIAGNLEHWPHGRDADGRLVRAADRARRHRARWRVVQRFDLPGGFHLLIGRDVQVRAQLRHAADRRAAVGAGWSCWRMASAGALVVRSLFRRTLANVSATAAAIAGGDFTQRVQAVRPRRRVRPARRDHQRHAGPHRRG